MYLVYKVIAVNVISVVTWHGVLCMYVLIAVQGRILLSPMSNGCETAACILTAALRIVKISVYITQLGSIGCQPSCKLHFAHCL